MTTTPASVEELSMQGALNRALDEILRDNDNALIFGEDVGALGGVFRITDGLQARYGADRVFDTPLAESAIIGTSVGLAMNGFIPIPEIQFDGFAFPAMNQIVTQLARMTYRSRGRMSMPVTLRLPSFGGIKAPEHHGESLESIFTHVPGLKIAVPSTPVDAYQLLHQSVAEPDPVIFMEPKSRYWNRATFEPGDPSEWLPVGASRIVREGKHATLIAWGAMTAHCLQVAELAAEDGVQLEVLDLRWLRPLDHTAIIESVTKTRRAVIVHEAPVTMGFGAELASLISEKAFDTLRAPVARVGGYDVPYPSGALEDEYLPSIDRVLGAVQKVLEHRRG